MSFLSLFVILELKFALPFSTMASSIQALCPIPITKANLMPDQQKYKTDFVSFVKQNYRWLIPLAMVIAIIISPILLDWLGLK